MRTVGIRAKLFSLCNVSTCRWCGILEDIIYLASSCFQLSKGFYCRRSNFSKASVSKDSRNKSPRSVCQALLDLRCARFGDLLKFFGFAREIAHHVRKNGFNVDINYPFYIVYIFRISVPTLLEVSSFAVRSSFLKDSAIDYAGGFDCSSQDDQ